DIGNVEIEAMFERKSLGIGIPQNVKTLGIGLHQAIFDTVMDHLDEVSGADGTGMKITLFDARIAAFSPFGARDIADPWRKRGKDQIEAFDHLLVASDHHAIASLKAPDATRSADIDIVDAFFVQRLATANIVLPERDAAIDDDVAGLHQT